MNYSYCNGQVAVITGAGGTLCAPIAVDLAKKGAKVVLVGRSPDKLEKVAAAIAAADGVCRIEPADVTDEAAIKVIADRVAAEWGPCRILVNGAGGNNVKAMPTRLCFCEKDLESNLVNPVNPVQKTRTARADISHTSLAKSIRLGRRHAPGRREEMHHKDHKRQLSTCGHRFVTSIVRGHYNKFSA